MKREEFTDSEIDLVVIALDLLLAEKRTAFSLSTGAENLFGFTERDFGIPQIVELLLKIDHWMQSDERESEVPA